MYKKTGIFAGSILACGVLFLVLSLHVSVFRENSCENCKEYENVYEPHDCGKYYFPKVCENCSQCILFYRGDTQCFPYRPCTSGVNTAGAVLFTLGILFTCAGGISTLGILYMTIRLELDV